MGPVYTGRWDGWQFSHGTNASRRLANTTVTTDRVIMEQDSSDTEWETTTCDGGHLFVSDAEDLLRERYFQ